MSNLCLFLVCMIVKNYPRPNWREINYCEAFGLVEIYRGLIKSVRVRQ